MTGPLAGLRVVELAGLAPAPFATMMLADHGADVVRIDRPVPTVAEPDLLGRGRTTVAADLKDPVVRDAVAALVDGADVLVEGFRPGVMERLGLGPDECLARNPRLVYGRMTGWGQDGPLARAAGHDINYVALSGALGAIGPAGGPPVPPLNLVGDFGGGGLLLAFGVLAALVERATSGRGQVVDAAMVDGAALLTTHLHSMRAQGVWNDERGTNLLDGAAPFYRCYATADGGHMSVGSIEAPFYAALLDGLGLADADLPDQLDRAGWPVLAQRFAEVFAGRTRTEWDAVFGASDACVHPVHAPSEVADAPHVRARQTFVDGPGGRQPAPAPRFDRTPSSLPGARTAATVDRLQAWGLSPAAAAVLTDHQREDVSVP
ncbi:CaiB/BaiF CoA-transferase family protein [Nocardioides sp. 1609]|uniref:CaiB/BaiF CoA transferase family protein n=1 Tax=Nocardioides sp. 1609 TaxID=2508327 RepID=UPI001070613F|nr:CaiB/BaiF CoA-transferase family protein [Nocardioides sp. 1609]